MNRQEVWARLAEAGLVAGELPEPEVGTPWPLRVMQALAGWFGAVIVLLLTVLMTYEDLANGGAGLLIGAVYAAAGAVTFLAFSRHTFAAQFALAVSLTGQALILMGLWRLAGTSSTKETFFVMAGVEAALALLVPNYLHRAITALLANVCLVIGATMAGAPGVATAIAAAGAAAIWLNPVAMARYREILEPAGYGFALSLVFADGTLVFGPPLMQFLLPARQIAPVYAVWAGPLAAGGVLLYTAWRLRVSAGWRGFALASVVAAGGLAAPGVSVAMQLVLLGFANGTRGLMVLGALAFGGYLEVISSSRKSA